MRRFRLLSLAVLLAFAIAEAESLVHRARHAAEKAAEAEASLCPFDEDAVHLCADRADADRAPDCALCMAGTVLVDPSVSGPGRGAPPLKARVRLLDQGVPSSAPNAGLPAPRGPPCL